MNHFESFDGLEMAYLDVGDGPVVVLLHGFASDHHGNWVQPGVVDALVGSGRRVVAPDARGHGASAKPHDPASFAHDAMMRDVQTLFDHLDASHVDLVGYSMGSLMSASIAVRDSRVRSLTLGGVGGNWSGDQRPANVTTIADALEADDPSTIADPVGRAFRMFADSTGADRLSLAALQRAPRGSRVDLGHINVRTQILTGDDDTLVGPPDVLAAKIPGASFVLLHGNHLSAVSDPLFTSSIVDFVNRGRDSSDGR